MTFLTIKKDWIILRPITVALLLFSLFLFQDLLHSSLRNYSFYLSEAALFNSFWLLFLPGIIFSEWWQSRLRLGNNSGQLRTVLIYAVTAAIHLSLFVLCVHGGSRLFFDHVYSLEWTFRYALAEHLYPVIIGYILVALAGVIREKGMLGETAMMARSMPDFTKRLAVKVNLKTVYLDVEEITCLRAESPYVAIHAEGRKYLEDTTLKALVLQLPPSRFVRIHRSCIINLSWVSSYISRGNGDYDVVLQDESIHRLSRNYTAEYKRRMAAHQLTR
ncbi:LytTR family DNA-binding domain-containing protein [Neolewinella persica]|uniref:LytTR family DNA-binding domain-containing protein n=1 Tax=Neolewinella persica TaxID=70998 RepID=UPI00037A5714|nr:LytTR family DNA-binding domain-containing protein [Neolewinella persica]